MPADSQLKIETKNETAAESDSAAVFLLMI